MNWINDVRVVVPVFIGLFATGIYLYIRAYQTFVFWYALITLVIGLWYILHTINISTIITVGVYGICMWALFRQFGYSYTMLLTVCISSCVIFILTYILARGLLGIANITSVFVGVGIRLLLTMAIFGLMGWIMGLSMKVSNYNIFAGIFTSFRMITVLSVIVLVVIVRALIIATYQYPTWVVPVFNYHIPTRWVRYFLVMFTIVATIYLQLYPMMSSSMEFQKHTLTQDTYPVNVYTVVVTPEIFSSKRQSRYNYCVYFDLLIMPSNGTNTNTSVIGIDDNINIRYNVTSGILSVWGLRDGSLEYTMIYGSYTVPIQTWESYVLNVSDGILDIFINGNLMTSVSIILKSTDINSDGSGSGRRTQSSGGIVIGDINMSSIQGYVKNIAISSKYVPSIQ